MYLVSEAQAIKHACTPFGLRLSRITLQGVKNFFHICDLFSEAPMFMERQKTLPLKKVLSSKFAKIVFRKISRTRKEGAGNLQPSDYLPVREGSLHKSNN